MLMGSGACVTCAINSDCGLVPPGPDCVTAKPVNPNPPSVPTGVTATDPETGAKLNVSWSANPEADIRNYTVAWGVDPDAPGDPCPFTGSATVGTSTSFAVTGLQNGVRYCVAVRATNSSDLTSAYSPEATGTPNLVQGLRSPVCRTSRPASHAQKWRRTGLGAS